MRRCMGPVGVVGDIIVLVVQSLAPTRQQAFAAVLVPAFPEGKIVLLCPGEHVMSEDRLGFLPFTAEAAVSERNLLVLFEARYIHRQVAPHTPTPMRRRSSSGLRARGQRAPVPRIVPVGSVVNKRVDAGAQETAYWSAQIVDQTSQSERRRQAIRDLSVGSSWSSSVYLPSSLTDALAQIQIASFHGHGHGPINYRVHHRQRFDLDSPNATRSPAEPTVGNGGGGGSGKERKGKERADPPPPTQQEPSTPTSTPSSQSHEIGRRLRRAYVALQRKEEHLPTAATNSAGASSLVSPSTTSPLSTASAGAGAKHTTLLRVAEIRVPLLAGLLLLLVVAGAALYRRHKKKQEQKWEQNRPPASCTRTPMQERGAGVVEPAGTRRSYPRDCGWDGGHSQRLCGRRGVGSGSGSSQTHGGADVPSTAGHGHSNSSLVIESLYNHRAHPRHRHGHSNSSVNHSTTNHVYAQSSVNNVRSSFGTTTTSTTTTYALAIARSPLLPPYVWYHPSPSRGCARTRSLLPRGRDTGTGMGTGARGRTDDGHGLAVRKTNGGGVDDAAPVHGYGVGSGSGNANDGRARPSTARSTRGEGLGGVRGARRC
ncbi:hypothetical protein B0H13DRAFT_1883957 [Mycena leptocephala]|nr:hypothetical protein B0H13DRAFT_1883957 [Mycena leptocephala]